MAQFFSILVVEDDTAMRDLVMRMLSEAGFGVLTANAAHEGLAILRQRPVDLLFTDIVLPGMNGVELVKEARRLRPSLKVLFATGHRELATTSEAMRYGKVLYKPLPKAELVHAVEELLAS
jgi:DNA-binding NtrC family response regulator